jgi:hypothetical protein
VEGGGWNDAPATRNADTLESAVARAFGSSVAANCGACGTGAGIISQYASKY